MLFPRLPGAFWAIPRGEQAVTGLSDSMSPGSIVQLIASYEPAFRVTFVGAHPPPEELYWRGPVLHEFDGYTWRRTPGESARREPLEYLGSPYRYRVALEPSRQRWWLCARHARALPRCERGAHRRPRAHRRRAGQAPVSFEALSYTRTRALQPLDTAAWRQDTSLPAGANPRSLRLAQALRARAPTDAAFVQAVLDYLRSGGFEYSRDSRASGHRCGG